MLKFHLLKNSSLLKNKRLLCPTSEKLAHLVLEASPRLQYSYFALHSTLNQCPRHSENKNTYNPTDGLKLPLPLQPQRHVYVDALF